MIHFIFGFFLCGYLIIQFFTLSVSPLPWIDEVFYASIDRNFVETGSLAPQIAVFQEEKQYGFVYFLLTGWSMNLLGFGISAFRLINFLAGLSCIWLSTIILKNHCSFKSVFGTYFFIFLIATDPFFYLCLHEGKADMTALAWMLWAIERFFLFAKTEDPKRKMYLLFLSGLFVSLALLTHPRIGVLLLAFGSVFLIWMIRQGIFKQFTYGVLWLLTIVGVYACWVWYAFGGVKGLMDLYIYQKFYFINQPMTTTYLWGNGYVPKQERLLILIAFLSFLIGIWRQRKHYFDLFTLLMLGSIGLFYWLIFDYGQYSIIILFFYYLLIFKTFNIQSIHFRNPILYGILVLGIYNLSYFVLKNVQIFSSYHQRNPQIAEEFVRKNIPSGSKVIGESMYFYAVLKAGSYYQLINYFETLEKREKRQREVFRYEYLIVTEHIRWREPAIEPYYKEKASLKKIATLHLPQSSWSKWLEEWGVLSTVERTGYSATIYQREAIQKGE